MDKVSETAKRVAWALTLCECGHPFEFHHRYGEPHPQNSLHPVIVPGCYGLRGVVAQTTSVEECDLCQCDRQPSDP